MVVGNAAAMRLSYRETEAVAVRTAVLSGKAGACEEETGG